MVLAKYQRPPQAPPNFNATPELLIAYAEEICYKTRGLIDKIVTDIRPEVATFENVVLPMARDEDISRLLRYIIYFYAEISTHEDLRKASREAAKILNDFDTDTSMREDIYKLVKAVYQKGEKLDPESKQLLEENHKGYIRNGLDLPAGPLRNRFKEIEKSLDDKIENFKENLNEEKGGIWFTKEELEGVPNDVVEGLEKGAGENEGKVKLSFKDPDLIPALKYALNKEVRKKIFIGNENKVSHWYFPPFPGTITIIR